MKRLIVFRSAHTTGELGRGVSSHPIFRVSSKGKKRLAKAANAVRPILEGCTFALATSEVPDIREAATILAKNLGKDQPYASSLLGSCEGTAFLPGALKYVQEMFDFREILILMVGVKMSERLPAYLGERLPGIFPTLPWKHLSKAEGVVINLESRSYCFINTPQYVCSGEFDPSDQI